MKRKFLPYLTVLMLAAMLLAACSGGDATQVPTETPEEPTADETVNESDGKNTLVVWDVMTRPEEKAIVDELIADFEAAHPGVTVEREAKNFDDLKTTAALALGSPDGPDVIQVNQGESDMGSLVQAGLLQPLNDYAEQYGWFDTFSAGLAALNSWSEDGKQMGTGNLYGLPLQAEIVGVYYRKDIFKENDLSVPTTYAEFETLMADLTAAGITPITYGGLDGWPAIHLYSEIQNAELGERGWYDAFMYTTGDVTFDHPANLAAAEGLVGWVENDFLTPGFEGIGYDDSWQLFMSGEGAMMLTGSWMSGEFAANAELGDQIGFFLVPPKADAGYKLSVGGTGLAFAIRNGSANADVAAEYLDYLYSEETANALAEAGFLPVYPIDPEVAGDGLLGDVVAAWKTANENDAVGYYMDWVTPTMYDTITAALQELMAGQITPAAFVDKVNQDYTDFLATK